MAWGRVESGFVVAAAVALAVALVAFVRTPASQRWRLTTAAAERQAQRRAERVQRGELVEIAAQPRRAWPRLVLWSLPLWPATVFVLATKGGMDLACARVAGINAMVLALGTVFGLLPLGVFALTLVMARMGWRGWHQRCFPPADTVVPFRAWGDRTWRGRARAALAMALPALGLLVVVLSVQAQTALRAGRSLAELTVAIEASCPKP